jgi:hypothetical protein
MPIPSLNHELMETGIQENLSRMMREAGGTILDGQIVLFV